MLAAGGICSLPGVWGESKDFSLRRRAELTGVCLGETGGIWLSNRVSGVGADGSLLALMPGYSMGVV